MSEANLDTGDEFYKTQGVMIISYCGTESSSHDKEEMIALKMGLTKYAEY